MYITKNITREEIACKCGCGQDTIDYTVAELVQRARDHFGKPYIIHCGNRCATHNLEIGGSKTSKHIISKAIDGHIDGVEHKDLADYLDSQMTGWGGIGLYSWGVHVDSRENETRWNG